MVFRQERTHALKGLPAFLLSLLQRGNPPMAQQRIHRRLRESGLAQGQVHRLEKLPLPRLPQGLSHYVETFGNKGVLELQ